MQRVVQASVLLLLGCGPTEVKLPADTGGGSTTATVPKGDVWAAFIPPGFPVPAVPEDNPISWEKIELGRHLFYDTRLSGNDTQACASCHEQERAFSVPEATSEGSTGEPGVRNAMALVNVAYNSTQTWANPVLVQLEQQIHVPLFGEFPVELGLTQPEEEVMARLLADPTYPPLFAAAYPDSDPGLHEVVGALASFLRVFISGRSPYDRFVQDRDDSALSEQAQRGFDLFFSEELECHHCHGGFNLSLASVHADSELSALSFHNTGLYNVGGGGAYPEPNTGLYAITGEEWDMGRFRAPTLRNVALTAPYMHDGSVATLEEVLDIYAAGGRVIEDGPHAGDGRANPYKSPFVSGFAMSDAERADLVAFLEALTDDDFVTDPRLASPWE